MRSRHNRKEDISRPKYEVALQNRFALAGYLFAFCACILPMRQFLPSNMLPEEAQETLYYVNGLSAVLAIYLLRITSGGLETVKLYERIIEKFVSNTRGAIVHEKELERWCSSILHLYKYPYCSRVAAELAVSDIKEYMAFDTTRSIDDSHVKT